MKVSSTKAKRIISLFMAVLMITACFSLAIPTSAICEDDKHITTETKAYKPATCTEEGWTNELTCRICGEIVKQSETISKTDHEYCDWVITTRPTTTETGSATAQCKFCGASKNIDVEKIVSPVSQPCASHDYTTGNRESDYLVLIQPTCTSTGIKSHYCRNCNSVEDIDTYIEISRIPHSFGEYKVTQKPDCTNSKISERECTVCHYIEIAYEGALGHAWYSWDPEIKGTCKTEAYQTRTCSRCGVTQEKYLGYNGPHTIVKHEYVAPTCTQTGLTYGLECSTCHIVDKAQTEIEKLPHVDKDKNLICDNCGSEIDCTCICHKTKGIMGLFSKLIVFIWRTLGTVPKCVCGIEHYYVYSPSETPTEPTATTVKS